MTRVLLIGSEPGAAGFDDPDLPPGVTAATITVGVATTLADMRGRGWGPGFCAIPSDAGAAATIERSNCVVIGGGIRFPAVNLELIESVVNAVNRRMPGTPIAFNSLAD